MENIINIHLKNKENYLNTYNKEILSYELSNYILEETKGLDTKRKIKFYITSDFTLEEEDKNNLISMIRKNFGADISEIIKQFQKQILSNYIIFILGVILLTIYSITNKENILSQFILIFGWVMLGESICNFFYKTIEKQHKVDRRKQIVNAKVEFISKVSK